MNNNNIEKPCKVWSEQGFFVNYKNRSLYSRYNPQKAIVSIIEKTDILPGTLILAFSPLLPYGIKELSKKLAENCAVFCIEADPFLAEFSDNENDISSFKNFYRISPKEIYNLPKLLHKSPWAGKFKRVIRIDFSGGTAFNKDLYDNIHNAMILSIKQYWANRVTIQKFGHKWHKNLFENLSILDKTFPITDYLTSIEKPIIVVGAGKSAEEAIPVIQKNPSAYFVLAVDTSFSLLKSNGITPDGIVLEEAQNAIREAFIGADKTDTVIFAGLSSIPHPVKNMPQLCYYATRFSETVFWDNLKQKLSLPYEMPPFGSVGLSAVKLALDFRHSDDIPVYVYGLDFSFAPGTSHARGTSAHKRGLRFSGKIKNLENYGCYSATSLSVTDKNGNQTYTLPVMKTYRDLFENTFYKEKNLWDCGSTGLKLGINKLLPQTFATTVSGQNKILKKSEADYFKNVKSFLKLEHEALIELRSLLSGEGELSEEQRKLRIQNLAEPREYIYLHFPDGYQFKMDTSFLKRIRAEIDRYLKVL